MFYPIFENQDFRIEQSATDENNSLVTVRAVSAVEDEDKSMEISVPSYIINSCKGFSAEAVFEIVQIIKDLEEVIVAKGKTLRAKEDVDAELAAENIKPESAI